MPKDPRKRFEQDRALSLRDFVKRREQLVRADDSRIMAAPDEEQRNLIPIAKAGGRGVLKLIGEDGITAEFINVDSVFQEMFPVDSLRNLIAGPYPSYSVSNYTELRTLDANTATVTDIINFVCTIVADLNQTGPFEGA